MLRGRTLISLSSIIIATVAIARAQDPKPGDKPEARKFDLVYRWDLLDGKTAVYDVEVVSSRKASRSADESPEGSEPEDEGETTTKQRLTMAFKGADGGRGRVTVTNERVQISVTQRAGTESATITYDSANPQQGEPKLKPTADAMIGKPYTLVVTRWGDVESVEGRPASELASFKGTFVGLPHEARAIGQTWAQVTRQKAAEYGDLVTTVTLKLAGVDEGKDPASTRIKVEGTTAIELDDRRSVLRGQVSARIEDAKGESHLVLDGRGLKVEEDSTAQSTFIVKQPSVVQQTKSKNKTKWKLVEVK